MKNRFKTLYIICLLFFIPSFLCVAQQVEEDWDQKLKPEAYFQEDSIRIGAIVKYSLSLNYPRQLSILFPDSTYNFEPFEYVGKKYFNTTTSAGFSMDSVVYELRTFELLDSLKLTLPVYLLEEKDSVAIYPDSSTIFFQTSLTNKAPQQPKLEVIEVPTKFNYPYFFIGLGILAVIAVLVLVFFGKRIWAQVRIYFITKKHNKFLLAFEVYHNKSELSEPEAEKMMILWKGYLENLSNFPIKKYTTKEIYAVFQDEKLMHSLQTIDSIVYAGASVENLSEDIKHLESFSDKLFEEKKNEIKNK